jgi:glutaredoxin-related protein
VKILDKICSVDGCNLKYIAKGLCNTHYMQKWNKENPDKVKVNASNTYQKNRTKILKSGKNYREKNHDKVLAGKKKHYDQNQPRLVSEKKEKYWNNPEKYKAEARKSNKKNKIKIDRKKKETHQTLRKRVLEYYSKGTPKCIQCGVTGIPFLNMDHIYGRKQAGHDRNTATGTFYRYLDKEHPPDYQVLCYNCNMIKELGRKKKFHLQTPNAIKGRRQKMDTKIMVLTAYSKGTPKCSCCGFSNLDGLGLDHIEGRKSMGHSRELVSNDLRMLLKREFKKTGKWPEGLQVLCHNCNGAKRESAVCPHQK